MDQPFTKRAGIFMLVLFLVLFFLTTVKYPYLINTQYFQDRWYPCLERFGSGTLYENDYHCSQGPVILASLYFIQQSAGDAMYFVAFFVGIFLSIFLFWILQVIIFKETTKKPQWLMLLIFSVVLYYPFF